MNDPSIKSNRTILILSLIAILFILWRVLVIGMSEYYVNKALDGDTDAISRALSWNANHPKAQYLQARQILSTDPEKAENLLTTSLQNNPTDTSALQAMAELQLAKGNRELSNKFMLESTRLAPANRHIRIDAGFFWAKTGQWDMAIENWQQALTTSPGLGNEIYPVLMQLAENEESLILLKPLIENPPEWWDNFSEYLAKNAKSLNTVATIASLRKQSRVPLSRDERKYLVLRLMKDGQWPRAYIAWANGLDKEQIKYMGSVYDGTFKLDASNEGFGWHILKVKGVSIRKQRSYGSSDDEALLLTFDGKEMVFKHFFQPLYLTRGEHELTANLKTDRLQSRGGLKWVVRCAGDEKNILGESSRLLGSSEWRQIKFKFTVPDSKECSNGQILRLESTGERTYDHILEGDIWFDRVTIRSIPKPVIPLTPEQKSAKDKAAKAKKAEEQAAKEKAAKEKAAREQAARAKAAKEKAAREQAARAKAAKEKAAREQAARAKAAKEKAAREQAARTKAAKEKAAQEQAAREKAAKEKAAREQAAREKAAKEKAAREQAAREKAAKEEAAQEQVAREKAAKEEAAREQVAREIAEKENAARDQAAQENAAEGPLSREKFIRTIPVQSATSITDIQVRNLITNYAFAYDTGDLTLMTRLFTDNVKTDDGTGINIIRNDYSKLFLNSYERRIKILNTEVDKTDVDHLKVTFDATVQVRKSSESEWKNYSGNMRLEIIQSGKEILISALSHSITADE